MPSLYTWKRVLVHVVLCVLVVCLVCGCARQDQSLIDLRVDIEDMIQLLESGQFQEFIAKYDGPHNRSSSNPTDVDDQKIKIFRDHLASELLEILKKTRHMQPAKLSKSKSGKETISFEFESGNESGIVFVRYSGTSHWMYLVFNPEW